MKTKQGKWIVIGLVSLLGFSCSSVEISGVGIADELAIEELSIHQLQLAYSEGLVTAVDVVRIYQNRIAELDPQLNSVIELNPDALTIAAERDEERRLGQVRSPMHGIPVLLKDNIDTADAMLTTAGSLALVNAAVPREDAHLVQQLRAAGAIILGKANLSEWANFRSTASASGWSARGGQARNPYVLDKSPCGSSSGSGVAVAANFSMVAVGTETDGSVVCPASINGIVGIKPTLGLVSRSGIIPISHSQDTAGPMARSVTDAVLLLNAMVGVDANDDASVAVGSRAQQDYTRFLSRNGLRGKRIGVVRQLFNDHEELNQLIDSQLEVLEQRGATLVDVEFSNMEEMSDAEFQVLIHEFKSDLNSYLENRGGDYQSLEALITFNRENADAEMPYFEQELFELAQATNGVADARYIQALATSKRLSQEEGIDKLLAEYNLDAFVAPGNDVSWPIDHINGDNPYTYIGSASLAAISGYPSITVPAGFIDELPIGLLFFAGAFGEPTLISIAYDYEQRTLARRSPDFLTTNE